MSKNNSPLKFIGGMIGSAATSLSGTSSNQNIMNGLFGNNLTDFRNSGNIADAAIAARQAAQVPRNPGAVRDPNNMRQSSGSGSIVSEADMNRVQDRNSGSGQLTQMMHETNSDMPMVKPMASKPRMQPGMGYSSVMSPFSPPELSTGDSLYGGEQQKQEIMNPMPIANIDTTGMNSLYS